MKKTATILVLLSLLSKPLGFIRQLLLSYYFGTTNITDAYFVATSAIGLMMIYFWAISTSYIPTYNRVFKNSGEKQAYKFTNNLISMQLIFSIFFMIIVWCTADYLIYIMASGFDNQTITVAKNLLIILSISIPFVVLSGELSSFLNIKNKSIQKSLAQYTSHFIIIFIILAGIYSVCFLAIGGVVCSIIFGLILMYLCYKQGLHLKLRLSFDKNVRYALLFALPMVLNSSIVLINRIVDQNIGSWLGEGIISAINYSANIQSLLIDGIIGIIMINLIFPRLSYLAVHNSNEAIASFRKILIILQCIVIPVSVLFVFFSSDIISFIYQRGEFGESAVNMTSIVLSTMAIGLPFVVYNMLCNNMLFAYHLSKLPLILSIVVVITNVIFSIILSHIYGLHGLILGTVISVIFGAITSALIFKYKIANLGLFKLISKVIRIVFISLLVAFITFQVRDFLHLYFSRNLSTFFYIPIAIFMYLALIQFARIEEITILRQTAINYLQQKLKK